MHPRIDQLRLSKSIGSIPIYIINLNRRTDRLRRILGSIASYDGSIYRYKAIDTRDEADLAYARTLDINETNWHQWQRGIGGYGNRFSHIDLLTWICEHAGNEFFAVAEDDLDFISSHRASTFIRKSAKILKENQADVVILSGWDFKPKVSLEWGILPASQLSRCFCTLGTQLNVYSRQGAEKFLELANYHSGLHLDEAIARLQVSSHLTCLGFRRNPFSCYSSSSDVVYQ